MRRLILSVAVAWCLLPSLALAETYIRCGTPEPPFDELRGGFPNDCGLNNTTPSEVYEPGEMLTISVVVHVIMSNAGFGEISDELVKSQIDILNEDFQGLSGTPGAPGYDTRLRFELATVNPAGEAELGITRTTNEFWFNDNLDPIQGWYYDALAWNPHNYLNIYTLSPEVPGGLILGYVPFFPASNGGNNVGTNEDRVVILWNSFGRNSGNPPYDQGRTATHELGHYFGLYHTFQSGCDGLNCYTSGDRICDTEPEQSSRGGCPGGATSCQTLDPINNYMDYTNDTCMNQLTHEQARRVRCTVQYWRPDLPKAPVAVGEASEHALTLHQNRPNPFNPTTHITFVLDRAGFTRLEVLDVGGSVIRTLAAGERDAGRHTLAWDGMRADALPAGSGVYFYRLSTPAGQETRRMILVK